MIYLPESYSIHWFGWNIILDTFTKILLHVFWNEYPEIALVTQIMWLQYTFESLFRSLHFALMDNASREYLFLTDFFMASETTALDLFNVVLGKTLSIYLVRWTCNF